MMDSLTPLSGMVAMSNIMLGEVIFGGVGSGMYGIIMFIILTVFIAGLMVGRSPEFLGKKIEAFEVKMAMIAILAPNFVILTFSAIGCMTTAGLSSLNNPGPHGLSEILYAFSSAAGNNGSAFAGLNANTHFLQPSYRSGNAYRQIWDHYSCSCNCREHGWKENYSDLPVALSEQIPGSLVCY